jgi:hypothetical protein
MSPVSSSILENLLADDELGVSALLGPPRLSRLFPGRSVYVITLRSLKPNWHAEQVMPPELVLENGERIPVVVTGSAQVTWQPEAVATGVVTPEDAILMIRAEDLPLEQAQQARWFIQRRINDHNDSNEV